ncbi:MAG: TetM/TetW/TetO/TetS family tetracycline resistance ribosomal protection protein [Eubacteriales bacterium]|nr:TetM/TetW/TetO/TetS family tetracycline resistance ribosomal protection protein [Eubacteriales bacterium]
MGEQKQKKHICAGLLAHVDAGKTTLSEGMLYVSGNLKKLGRVDHKDAFLDTYRLERERGITIFSKQAILSLENTQFMLLDTPGHVDFSTEMERTLQVLDYAILVISGSDGVQGHTETLWRLLEQYRIPTFLFINKMDLDSARHDEVLAQLKHRLSDGCVDFSAERDIAERDEEAAMCSEALMERYLEDGELPLNELQRAIIHRELFPCFFGSALRLDGVEDFVRGMERYTVNPQYPAEFGAKVYKISRDPQGNRLTWMKITGGGLQVKTRLTNAGLSANGDDIWEEKADQLRLYSGEKYQMVDFVPAGSVCAVTGLTRTQPGDALGLEPESLAPVLEPVLTYQLILPEGCDVHTTLGKLKQLEEEDPQLHIVWNERLQEIHIQLMGEIQVEVLKSLIMERFGLDITFGTGNIVYKETIAAPVEGIGHFEPLRHYAETHLLLEPLERGSGLEFATICSEDVLNRNWQRLILTHLEEKEHLGVLTGSPITDMRITLLTGRAHAKHTEGGDFRQATYRAIRQGLMKAESVLLEPWYTFRLELPQESVGRAMSDIQTRGGTFDPPESNGEFSILTGTAPVSEMRDYPMEVAAYTKGCGRLSLAVDGYRPCHNADEVIEKSGYEPEADVENTPHSVFCSHGAGYTVKWNEVEQHMHLPAVLKPKEKELEESAEQVIVNRAAPAYTSPQELDKELKKIFERTYGTIQPRAFRSHKPMRYDRPREVLRQLEPATDYLLVDGYNIIFSWDDLSALAKDNMDAARQSLMDTLCNYQAYRRCELILVFDAYRVPGQAGIIDSYHNIHVVYTKEAETADMFIEKVSYEISRRRNVRVATSDGVEQIIILAHGAQRISARAFRDEVEQVNRQISDAIRRQNQK